MKKQPLRFILYTIIIYLTCGVLNPAIAASQPSGRSGTHFCGVTDSQPNKRYSDQFPNRRYARSFAANVNVGEPRTVRMIYFLPNDRPYHAEVIQRMKDEIRSIQAFYAEQMEAHGYGKVTFRVETDPQGEPIVHRVDGQHPDSYYIDDLTPIFDESERAFDLDANISLIVIDNSSGSLGGGALGLGERGGKNSGYAVVTGGFNFGVAAHELGHAFGLEHDFRDGAYIMSYGPGWNRLSACSAEFLSVHPYFNLDIPIDEGQPPTIELISPRTYPAGSRSVPVQFQVNDSGGLHQVFLRGLYGLIACRGLGGEKNALVEFNYDGVWTLDGLILLPDAVAHRFFVDIVDTDGNVSNISFGLTESSPHHIATLEGHTAWLRSVAFSPDGKTLASGGEDRTVKLWDVATKQDISTLPHGSRVNSAAFSRDGKTLASGSVDATVKLWDVTTGANFATLSHASGWINSVAFSRDGRTLASGGDDHTIKLWDVGTKANIGILEGHTFGVNSVAFSRDGRTLASGSTDATVKLWDVATGANFATLPHMSGVNSVAFSSDGTTLASGTGEGTVELWDTSGWTGARREALAEIDIPDSNLRAAIATTLGKPSSASIVRGNVTTLTHLRAVDADISNLTGLEGATKMISLRLPTNNISDISPLAELTKLTVLDLGINNISDISPLAANTGLGIGDTVDVQGNPLSYTSIHTHIPDLQSRGVTVEFDNQTHPALLKISGDNQKGASFTPLSQPFVVEVQDANGSSLVGVSVTFAVVAGGGTLSSTITRTNENGRAQSTLTLGPNLGTNTVEVSAAGIQGTAIFHAISDTEAPPIIADVNGDGTVNVLDLIVVASELGNTGTNLVVDVNRDGVVSILDLILVASMFEGTAAAPAAQPQAPETLTAVEVQGWLTDARALEVRNSIMKRGFLVLEQLLVSLIPTETELLHNYPNPFNPETWIPYRLAEDAFVTLTIYDGNGWVVRTFDVGHRIAAAYENRSKAIYWNGKNGLGESVASGVYFYTLTAGDYSATRKMLVLK